MTQILQPPSLELDKVLYAKREMWVITKIERRIIWNLLNQLRDKGFGRFMVYDGEEETQCGADIKAVMELVFNLDDAHVYLEGPSGKRVWIYLVFGNDGSDVISDYGYHPNEDFDGWNQFMDKDFDPEIYV